MSSLDFDRGHKPKTSPATRPSILPVHSTSSSTDSISTALESPTASRMRPTKINILPRAGTYTPLDNGSAGPSKRGRRFGWKSVALAVGLVVGVVWMVGPRDTYVKYTHASPYDDDLENIEIPKNQKHPPFVPTDKGTSNHDTSKTPLTLPTSPHSPETDPDLLKTVHCVSPHSPTKPLVQYALMLDAGSTGSRIHIYKFHNCKPSPTLEYEVFKMIIPGLSSYATEPIKAAESLDQLMDEAVRVVPEKLQGCTKVAVKATAGLRLLGKEASDQILGAVKERLRSRYKFTLAGENAVAIMDGKDEGVYAWITANYLLGTIGGPKKADTYAVLDLGGASTQIVFEPTFKSSSTMPTLEEGDHKYLLSFGGKTHTLYQHSYLGYGLMRARRSVHNLVGFMWDFRLDGHHATPGSIGSGNDDAEPEIPNPCLSQGTKRKVKLDGGKWSDGFNATMSGADVGSFENCNRVVELVMAKDAICHVKPCSFNGVYQPSMLDTFPSGGILALSYFYDRISPLLPSPSSASTFSKRSWSWNSDPSKKSSKGSSTTTDPSSLPIAEIAHLAQHVCAGPKSWEHYWGPQSDYAKSFQSSTEIIKGKPVTPSSASASILKELHERPEYCLDLTFMHALLRLGYEFRSERSVRFEKKVDGVELGWCLGAVIAMLLEEDDSLKCVA